MRTSYNSVSSARRLSSWLMVVLGLAAYVGLLYGLTMLPLQFEVPLPHWGIAVVPPLVYGLLVLLCVRWPSPLRWLVGTALLSGLHLLLGQARGPVSAFLDPSLAGRPLPWVLPPPLPELVGLILLLVPLRDLLRARPRSARERVSAAGRAASSGRVRTLPARPTQPVAREGRQTPSETLVAPQIEVSPETTTPATPVAPPIMVTPPVDPEVADAARRRRVAAGAERRRETTAPRPARRSDVVLRIALDRIMGQLPPGTFLAPEDEVAASLSDPGYLLIPGPLVVTQLSEGIALVAWSDIVEQFPPRLIGLGPAEISEHLGDGLRLPLDEVVGQLPHELFVADTPEVELPGLDRIPVPFHPLEESEPTPAPTAQIASEIRPAPPTERPRVAPSPTVAARPVVELPVEPKLESAPAPVLVPPTRIEEPVLSRREPDPLPESVHVPEPEPVAASTAAPAPVSQIDEPTVRISFGRVMAELPAEGFRGALDQLGARMQHPDALLIPLAQVLPQLGEGLIQVGWDLVASQFPREQMAMSDAEMADRLPNGIQLPLDEIIRQISADLFMSGGPAVDVSGLESFPAPFQPLVSDPAPAPEPDVSAMPEPAPMVNPESVFERAPEPEPMAEPPLVVEAASRLAAQPPRPSEPVEVELAPVVAPPIPVVVELPPVIATPIPAAIETPAVPEPALPIASEPVLIAESPTPAVLDVSHRLDIRPESEAARIQAKAPQVVAPAPVLEAERPTGLHVAPSATPDPRWKEPVPESIAATTAREWRVAASVESTPSSRIADPTVAAEARRILTLLAPIASFEVTIQPMEGVTVFAMTAPAVAPETAVAATGLALPLLTDRRAPWPLDQITLRGPETALVLTPLSRGSSAASVLATAAPRGGSLALLEILCRRVGAEGSRRAGPVPASPDRHRNLVPAAVPDQVTRYASSFTAYGPVTASVLRDTEGEGVFYFFLPRGADVPAVGAFAQDLQAVIRKAAGSGAVFRTAVLRSGNTLVVIQPEEVGHGRSIVVVAGGDVTRPGLAYRQVERATTILAHA
jgi:hypothetical protein